VGIALLCLYGLAIALMAGRRGGGGDTAAAFFVNNRAGSAMDVGCSIIASCIGASATIGMIGLAFAVGTPAFWWLGAGVAGLLPLALLLARKVRESGAYTLPHLVERYLGPQVRPLISTLIVTAWMAVLAAQFTALAEIIRSLSALPQSLNLGICFALVALHSLGGQAAVMRLDRLQSAILIVSLLFLLCWLGVHTPNPLSLTPVQVVNADFPPEKLIYFLVVVGANYLVCPMLFGRLFSARDGASARRGVLLAAAGLALCAAVIVAVGLACRGLVPPDTPQDAVLSTILSDVLPPWMHIPVSLVLLSAIVSSADSCLLTAATVLSHDLLRRNEPAIGRVCVLALGLAGLGLSLWGKGIMELLLMAYDVYACGVVGPVFVGLVLGGRRRMDPRFACAAVLVGGSLGLTSALSGRVLFSYAGLALGVLLALAGMKGPHALPDEAARKYAIR
jgi:SSS family solute:Na+ symporter